MKWTICVQVFRVLLAALVLTSLAVTSVPVRAQDEVLRQLSQYERAFVDSNGELMVRAVFPALPPLLKMPAASVPNRNVAGVVSILSDVPASTWSYGCSATSAAMLFGYYDRIGYANMYAGQTNGGVAPLTNAVWGQTAYAHVICGENPLSASHNGIDGLLAKGHVDDYWIDANNSGPDPFVGHWDEHSPQNCAADYMGTSQSKYGNVDGATSFYYYQSGLPLLDYTGCEPSDRDGCHGIRLFAESKGYTVQSNFTQYILGKAPLDPNIGFSFAEFRSEIDAGRPVLIHLTGHTMLGYGYDASTNTVYVHDTWDYNSHTMT